MKGYLIAFVGFLVLSQNLIADEPVCYAAAGEPYCEYEGEVRRLYVNSTSSMLFYFDAPLPVGATAEAGMDGVTQRSAAMVRYNETPDFGKFFYSAALTAQASGKDVVLVMKDKGRGYLLIEKISIK